MDDIVFMPETLESLMRSRQWVKDSELLAKLDEFISLELDMAIMGSKKALSNLKSTDNVKRIK